MTISFFSIYQQESENFMIYYIHYKVFIFHSNHIFDILHYLCFVSLMVLGANLLPTGISNLGCGEKGNYSVKTAQL